jgi:hypothetical protein
MTEYARAIELDADILTESENGVLCTRHHARTTCARWLPDRQGLCRAGNIDGALEYLERARDGKFPEMSRVDKEQGFATPWSDPRLKNREAEVFGHRSSLCTPLRISSGRGVTCFSEHSM